MRTQPNHPGLTIISATCLALLASSTVLGAETNPARRARLTRERQTFKLEEISVFDYEGQSKHMLTNGQFEPVALNTPDDRVKAYPQLKSQKPLYGKLTVNRSCLDYFAIPYFFVLDQSTADSGYDLLYFDINHDFDLTNDKPLALTDTVPDALTIRSTSTMTTVAFERLRFNVKYPNIAKPHSVELIPYAQLYEDSGHMRFITPTARRANVKFGKKEIELILSQGSQVTGRWDQPMVYAFIADQQFDFMPMISAWRTLDGKLYSIKPSADGTSVRVSPYRGRYGTLDLGPGTTAERSYLQRKDNAIIDLTKCIAKDGKITVPVGYYLPLQIGFSNGDVRVSFAAELDTTGDGKTPPPTFPIHITKDKPFELKLADKPQVVFQSPPADKKIAPGDEVSIQFLDWAH